MAADRAVDEGLERRECRDEIPERAAGTQRIVPDPSAIVRRPASTSRTTAYVVAIVTDAESSDCVDDTRAPVRRLRLEDLVVHGEPHPNRAERRRDLSVNRRDLPGEQGERARQLRTDRQRWAGSALVEQLEDTRRLQFEFPLADLAVRSDSSADLVEHDDSHRIDLVRNDDAHVLLGFEAHLDLVLARAP